MGSELNRKPAQEMYFLVARGGRCICQLEIKSNNYIFMSETVHIYLSFAILKSKIASVSFISINNRCFD